MKIKTSIIIANYNGKDFLPVCLNSVSKFKPSSCEIIVIDDCSTDNSIDIVKKFQKKDKAIKVIQNKVNLGAAESRNIAIKNALGEIIIFLDNDTEIERDSLSVLVTKFADKKIGAVQALLVDFEHRNVVQNGGGLLIPQVAWLAPYYQKKAVKTVKKENKKIVAISACLAVRSEALKAVGGFDKDLSVYTEDLDFSWRLWIAGWQIILSPNSIVYHWTKSIYKRKTMHATYERIYFHLAKNSFTSIVKNYEIKNVVKFLPTSIAINLGRAFLVLIARRKFYAITGTFKAIWWFAKNISQIIYKRSLVQATRQKSDKVLFVDIFSHDSLVTNYRKYFL